MENLPASRGRGRGALLLEMAMSKQESKGPSTVTTDSGMGLSITKSLPAPLTEIAENTPGALRPSTGRGRLLQDLVKTITSERIGDPVGGASSSVSIF